MIQYFVLHHDAHALHSIMTQSSGKPGEKVSPVGGLVQQYLRYAWACTVWLVLAHTA